MGDVQGVARCSLVPWAAPIKPGGLCLGGASDRFLKRAAKWPRGRGMHTFLFRAGKISHEVTMMFDNLTLVDPRALYLNFLIDWQRAGAS